MRQFALYHRGVKRACTWLALLAVVIIGPLCAKAQLAGTATIEGTITDSSGAVVPGAKVLARNEATGSEIVRTSSGNGLYNLSPLDAGTYDISVTAQGFEKLARTNVHVDGMQVLALDLSLQVGANTVTVTVSTAPPALETENATLGAAMENEVYQSLPLEMGGANGVSTDQRRVTDYAALMPGVTNNETKNNESDEPMVVNGNGSASEMYVEGIPMESASVAGDPRFIWPAFSVDTVDQFQLKTTAYSAEYQGLGVENFTLKSGSNQIHGSAYGIFRNTALDSAGFIPAQYPTNYPNAALAGTYYKPPEHMNEYGVSIGGPIWRNKVFLFGNYMGFRYSALTKPQAQVIPTPAELCGDFSQASTGNTQNIYDPTSQALVAGSYQRTQFSGPTWTASGGCGSGPAAANVIPQNELSPIAKYLQQWMPAPNIPGAAFGASNYIGSYQWGLNNWSSAERLDYNISDRHKVSIITGIGRQGLVGTSGSQTTNVAPMPYKYTKTYAPISYDGILEDTFVINQNLVNQFKYAAAKYHSPDQNPTYGNSSYAATAAGITGLPTGQASGGFPDVVFSGGTQVPAKWGPQDGYIQNTDDYVLLDNLEWVHGKHSFTFGGQVEWMSFNDIYADGGTTPATLNFGVNETAAVSGSSATVTKSTGQPFASYMIGAVDSGSYTQYGVQETGARYRPFAFYVNDDWRATSKLTVNLGLRWDSMPPMQEVHDNISFLNPTGANSVTGANDGTLEFGGSGTDSCNCHSPMKTYYKDFGPRLGLAYSVNNKTVIRAAYGLYYAHGGGTSGGANTLPTSNMELGLSAAPNPSSPAFALPAFYLNGNTAGTSMGGAAWSSSTTVGGYSNNPLGTSFGAATVAAPPVTNPTYGTYYASNAVAPYNISTTLAYLDPYYGGRTPTFEGWSFGVQRLITQNITLTASYVGNQGHFLTPSGSPRGYWANQLDPQYLALGSTALGSKTASNMPSGAFPYATFNNTVAQGLLPFPQYKGVADTVPSVGNANYNSLQVTVQQRLAYGLTFMLGYTYSKTIDDVGTFRTGYAIPAGVLANSGKAYPIDRIERSLSTQDQPQNLVFTDTYDLPFGAGHIGGGNPILRNIVGGWRLSDVVTFVAGNPLAITSSTCTGLSGAQGTCMPAYVQGFTGSARQNGKWGQGATAATLSTIQYINPAAFQQTASMLNPGCTAPVSGTTNPCAGGVLGDMARTAPYGLRGPGNYDIDGSLRRTFNIWRDGRVKFVFEGQVFNAVNHVWFGSSATTADGTIGSSVGSASLGTVAGQANNPRQWQFGGHFNY
jgi:Carboxypeptidase regulatory-like domain